MANWVLTQKGTVIPCQSICRLTADKCSDSNEIEAGKRASFTTAITAKLGDSVTLPSTPLPTWEEPEWDWDSEPYGDDSTPEHKPFEADFVNVAGKPIMMHSLTDVLINAEVLLSKDESVAIARVLCQAVNSNGKVISQWDSNPASSILWSMSVNSMMGLSTNIQKMLSLQTFTRKEMPTASLLCSCTRLWITSCQGRQ